MTKYNVCSHYSLTGSDRYCKECKHRVYPSSEPVSIVLVTNEDNSEVLLVRQPRHPKGMFSCIAGFVDAGEAVAASVGHTTQMYRL